MQSLISAFKIFVLEGPTLRLDIYKPAVHIWKMATPALVHATQPASCLLLPCCPVSGLEIESSEDSVVIQACINRMKSKWKPKIMEFHLKDCSVPFVLLPDFFFFLHFFFISWRLITLQYCSDFCHTLTWISHRFTCVPHPEPPCCLISKRLTLSCWMYQNQGKESFVTQTSACWPESYENQFII